MPAIMRRHLNCIKTVQMFKLSGGIFFLQPWMNRRRGHLRFSYQLNRRKGRRNCPWPDAVVTAVDSRISCIGHGGIGDPLAQPEIASGDEVDCKVSCDDCRSYGGGDDLNGLQTLGREALMHVSIGGDCREGNASNSEAAEVNGEQGVECQPDQCQPGLRQPSQPDCQLYQCLSGQSQSDQCKQDLCQPGQCQSDQCQQHQHPDQSRCQPGQCLSQSDQHQPT